MGLGKMFGWFKIKSPLTAKQRSWINQRFDWLRAQFGDDRLQSPIVTPTDEFFPDPYSGTQEDAAALFSQVCQYMDVNRTRIDLRFYTSAAADVVRRAYSPELQSYALGVFEQKDERIDIWLEATDLKDPTSVIATFAHELGHVHLLADERCDGSELDHEPLTDLLTVYFGLGIFRANSVVREVNWSAGRDSGWSVSKRGYLSLPEYAYALALYAFARNERRPPWAGYLRKDIRALLDTELKDLAANGGPLPLRSTADDIVEDDPSEKSPLSVEEADDSTDFAESELEPVQVEDDGLETAGPDSADDWFSEGVSLATDREFHLAIEAFTQALRQNPHDAEVWLHRAQASLAIERCADAICDATEALRLEPDETAAECCRATAHLKLRQFADALPDLDRAIRRDRKEAEAYFLRGVAMIGLQHFDEAVKDLKYAIRNAPKWPDNYLALSLAYHRLGNAARGDSNLQQAIRLDATLADKSERIAYLPGVEYRI
jgi:tetratricopeptide (TPR) repeat protein